MLPFDEQTTRLSIFIGVLILCAVLESLFPRKQRTQKRFPRCATNLGLVFFNSLVIKLMGPVTALSVAAYTHSHQWGGLATIHLPIWAEVILAIICLDLAIYVQHIFMHKVPILWRLHQVHHADRDIDVTTGIRFHPVEIVLSMLYKCLIIILLGPAVLAVLLFEVILNASAMFSHANLKLPLIVDKLIRSCLVTPDMHRVHHSTIVRETNSNYGFCLSIWDKLFKTYNVAPASGHDGVVIGLEQYQTQQPSLILWCLKLPFHR